MQAWTATELARLPRWAGQRDRHLAMGWRLLAASQAALRGCSAVRGDWPGTSSETRRSGCDKHRSADASAATGGDEDGP